MRFTVIFIILFSCIINANASLYQPKDDLANHFLKFKVVDQSPRSEVKLSSIQSKSVHSNASVDTATVKNKDITKEDKKTEFKRFGSGKTLRKDIDHKNEWPITSEKVCDIPNLKKKEKEKEMSVNQKSIEHKRNHVSKKALSKAPKSFSTVKKEAVKKESVQAMIESTKSSTIVPGQQKSVEKIENKIQAEKKPSLLNTVKSKKLSADQVMSEKISIEVPVGDVFTIASKLMPSGWRVMMSVKNNKLLNKKFYFVTTKSRGEALNDLSQSVGVKLYYFFDLVDENKNPSPLLIVSDN